MGRRSTGTWTTFDAFIINITSLSKAGLILPGYMGRTSWVWKAGEKKRAEIGVEVYYGNDEKYLRLTYSITRKGETKDIDYKIELLERPSNLGIGKVLFFRCPVSMKVCRKLYLAYDSPVFKCREAYRNRIYYPLQLSGKLGRSNDQYWQFERQIEDLMKGRAAHYYNGKMTRRAARLQKLFDKQDEADWLRWQPESYPCGLRRSMQRFMAEMKEV